MTKLSSTGMFAFLLSVGLVSLQYVLHPAYGFSVSHLSKKITHLNDLRLYASTASSAVATTSSSGTTVDAKPVVGTIAFLVPASSADGCGGTERKTKFGIHSPVDQPTYHQAAMHLSKKAYWFSDGQVQTSILTLPTNEEEETQQRKTLEDVNILIAMGLTTPEDIDYAQSVFERRLRQSNDQRYSRCQFALDCGESPKLPTFVGPYDANDNNNFSLVFPWTDASSGRRFQEQMDGLFHRWTSDDFTVALMLFLNRFSGHAIDWVKDSADATWEKGPLRNVKEFYGMGTAFTGRRLRMEIVVTDYY
jgi:hypothetical protein